MPITGEDKGEQYRGFRISELWAFVTIDAQYDDEGIIGTLTRTGWVPLIASDRVARDQMEIFAAQLAKEQNQTIQLIKFSNRELIKEFKPNAEDSAGHHGSDRPSDSPAPGEKEGG